MGKYLGRIVIAACFTALVSMPLMATTVKTSGNQAQAGAQDKNINPNSGTNMPGEKSVAPASKGGPASKGPFDCHLHVDNSTAWYVQFYFNGDAAGTIGPWGDYYPNITVGSAQLYARAVFDNGTVLTFGPVNYQCTGNDNVYTWTLTP
jgi:hypothetical protein